MGESNFTVKTSSYSNEVSLVDKDSRLVLRQHRISTDKVEMDVHADYWSLALFQMDKQAGKINVIPQKEFPHEGCVAVYLPPFSIIEWTLNHGAYNWLYLVKRGLPPQGLPKSATLINNVEFKEVERLLEGSVEDLTHWLREQKDTIDISRIGSDHLVAEKLKENIDKSFRGKVTIKDIQINMSVSPAMSSRLFKKRYGLSPIEYKKQLRMKQAAMDLMFEAPTVSDAHYGVGIEDSSYFHRCFKEFLNGTPAQFKAPSKNF